MTFLGFDVFLGFPFISPYDTTVGSVDFVQWKLLASDIYRPKIVHLDYLSSSKSLFENATLLHRENVCK